MKKPTILTVFILTSLLCYACNDNHATMDGTEDKPVVTGHHSHANKLPSTEDACMTPITAEDSAKFISHQVLIKGAVENKLVLTTDSLKGMDVVTIKDFTVECQTGATVKHNKICKGILLKDILKKAVIQQRNHKDRNFYIVAKASDSYMATFSWAEIVNNPTGDNIFVLFEENGLPITKQGEMILICKNDIKTGPRHVYWLSSIEVNRVS